MMLKYNDEFTRREAVGKNNLCEADSINPCQVDCQIMQSLIFLVPTIRHHPQPEQELHLRRLSQV